MKVKELIKILEKMNPEYEVSIAGELVDHWGNTIIRDLTEVHQEQVELEKVAPDGAEYDPTKQKVVLY